VSMYGELKLWGGRTFEAPNMVVKQKSSSINT